MGTVYHLGESTDDFAAVAAVWPSEADPLERNPAGQGCVINAMRNGGLIIARDEDSREPLGVAILDYFGYAPALHVETVLVNESRSDADSIRRHLNLRLLQLAMRLGAPRLVFHTLASGDHSEAVSRLNQALEQEQSPLRVEILGEVREMFGEGRPAAVVSIFIAGRDRPRVSEEVIRASYAFYRTALRSGSPEDPINIMATKNCCKGCSSDDKGDKNETKDAKDGSKEKEESKDKEGSKDGKDDAKDAKDAKDGADKSGGKDGVESFSKLAPEKGAIDSTGILHALRDTGVTRFNVLDRDFPFRPLI